VGAAQRSDWPGYRAHLSALRKALLDHIGYEEDELFPELERRGLAAEELAALREEHMHLRRQLDALQAAAPQHDPEGCIAELEHLAAFQRAHHDLEMAVCYAQADGFALPAPPQMSAESAPLDLRGLQPPEPIVRIFEALERAPRQPLRFILPHEPVPLYALLRERGFRYSGSPRRDGGFEVLIEAS
jgi:hypothetical protein